MANGISAKPYKCSHCGHKTTQSTNHYGQTYSFGNYNKCPNCGWKRPMEITVWEYDGVMPEGEKVPEPWKIVKLGNICDIPDIPDCKRRVKK